MNHARPEHLVLSVYPTSRGFAFVLFEGPESPFDWGVKEIKEKHRNTKTLSEIKKIIYHYQPEVLVIEDTTDGQSRRSSRIRKLYRSLVHLAESKQIALYRFSRSVVKRAFSSVGARTKYEIAQSIALNIPAFAHRVPPVRKIWMGEDPRQSLFDAAALGLVFYQHALPYDLGISSDA